MSEKEHIAPGEALRDGPAGEESTAGAPIETQRSGFDGERRSKGAGEGCPEGCPEAERTLDRRVSRETFSEEGPGSPDVSRETHQGEINSDSERPAGHSSPGVPAPPAPAEPEGGSADAPDAPTPPPPGKNKRSSFYVYLAVLFGAAFLMLLLAYFVQRRNNETAISALRSTMNLSQDELMEEIQGLEEEKQGLLTEKEALQAQMDELNAQLESANKQYEFLSGAYDKYVGYTSVLQALYAAEVRQEARDYDGAAAELTDIEYQYFVDTIGDYDAETEHYNPEGLFLRPRFDALVEELTRRGALDEGWAGQEQAP